MLHPAPGWAAQSVRPRGCARGHRGHREGRWGQRLARCPELGSLPGQLGMTDGPAVPAQGEQHWQLAAFLAQGQTPGRLLLPLLCPPSPPHRDSHGVRSGGRGAPGGGPLPRDGARGHPRAVHPGRQALRPRAGAARTTGAFWVERRARGRGRSDHSRGDGHGVGVPPETAWRAAHHSRLCCRSQGRAGWGGAWGQRSRPRSPPRRHPGPAWPSIPSGEEAGRSRVAP